MECPICHNPTNKLVIPADGKKLGCRECVGFSKAPTNVNLGQTLDTYTKKDGTKGKITVGKNWELENRRVSMDDGRTIINQVTGKPPEY